MNGVEVILLVTVVLIIVAILIPKPGRSKPQRAALHRRLLSDAAERRRQERDQ